MGYLHHFAFAAVNRVWVWSIAFLFAFYFLHCSSPCLPFLPQLDHVLLRTSSRLLCWLFSSNSSFCSGHSPSLPSWPCCCFCPTSHIYRWLQCCTVVVLLIRQHPVKKFKSQGRKLAGVLGQTSGRRGTTFLPVLEGFWEDNFGSVDLRSLYFTFLFERCCSPDSTALSLG